jgi:hypothetical protein
MRNVAYLLSLGFLSHLQAGDSLFTETSRMPQRDTGLTASPCADAASKCAGKRSDLLRRWIKPEAVDTFNTHVNIIHNLLLAYKDSFEKGESGRRHALHVALSLLGLKAGVSRAFR